MALFAVSFPEHLLSGWHCVEQLPILLHSLTTDAIIIVFSFLFIFLLIEEVAVYRMEVIHSLTSNRIRSACKLILKNFLNCFIFLCLLLCIVHIQYQLLSINKCHLTVPQWRHNNYRRMEEDTFLNTQTQNKTLVITV